MDSPGDLTIRHELQPGDIGRVTAIHGKLYAEEYGLSHVFEAYVAETLAEFGKGYRPERDRLWLVERDGRLVGSIGIVGRDDRAAQLRWLLVAPEARGCGLGRHLVEEALAFCREAGYRSVYLWTVHLLPTAARLYTSFGFAKTESLPPADWGVEVIEERYDLML
jgi:GNAT superfamily N-acetyltransferase